MSEKILFIGSFPDYSKKETIGGATVIVENTSKYFKEQDLLFSDYNLYKYSTNKYLITLLNLFILPFKIIRYDKVFLNVTQNTFVYLSPFINLICRLFNKKMILRFIGGDIGEVYDRQPNVLQNILKLTSLKSDLVLAETKQNQLFFEALGANMDWIPNCRRYNSEGKEDISEYNKRFVFISQVKKTKGVLTIIEASEFLDKNVTVDVYGPFHDEDLEEMLDNSDVNYQGVLKAEEVIPKLKEYDILLLPTYHEGEGYPGIIIESMAVGLPVVTTNWKSIPDMIQDGYNGRLLIPKDAILLAKTMNSISEEEYLKMANNARDSFKNFDLNVVYGKLLALTKAL